MVQIFNFFRSKKNRDFHRREKSRGSRGRWLAKGSPPDEIQSLPRVGITAGGTLARDSPAKRQCWPSHRDENIARDFIIDRRGPCLRNCRVAFFRPFLFSSAACFFPPPSSPPPRPPLTHTGYFHRSVLIIRAKEPLRMSDEKRESLRGYIPQNSDR